MLRRSLAEICATWLAPCAALACGVTAPSLDEESTIRQPGTIGCPELGCNLNAASLGNGLYFHELHTGHRVNTVGVQYDRFESAGGADLELRVDGDELYGLDASGGLYRGVDLIGARIFLRAGTAPHVVRIAAFQMLTFWVGDPGQVPTYTFVYTDPVDHREHPVCTTHDVERAVPTTVGFVFTGDRYDAVHKTVAPGGGGWFNVACAGSAMAKMHLLRHTAAGQDATHATTIPQRTAMLKMLTDDICGTGRSFTADGEAVFYTDQRSWHPFQSGPVGQTESIWSDAGAICLDEPRRLREDGPGVLHDIVRECGRVLPSCAPIVAHWTSHGYGLTANPP